MNYLAHAYLSFGDKDILLGNMISDFVKGKQKFNFDVNIQEGIKIHRAIDEFTDQHPITKEAKEYFRPIYRLYSGAFIDVVYDHFLALDKVQFPNDNSLLEFCSEVYNSIQPSLNILPVRFQKMFPYMRDGNWLYNYRFEWGMKKSFEGLQHRAKYISETDSAFEIFNTHYSDLQKSYNIFFPELKTFVLQFGK